MKIRRTEAQSAARQFRVRGWWVLSVVVLCGLAIVLRAVDLQVMKHDFLAREGESRTIRKVTISTARGNILDRSGEPLAVSTPVDTVWSIPAELAGSPDQLPRLAKALNRDREWLTRRVTSNLESRFLVLEKQMQPDEAERIKAMNIPGVYLQREYRRYYPAGEVTGHVLGFTGEADQGQEGLELGFDQVVAGEDGLKRVIQDQHGNVVENVESIRPPRPGADLVTSLDLRIQYLAYRELKAAIRDFDARAGSVIVLDVWTGEILAMVNQPSFNPNDRTQFEVPRYRNRAATDIFEPGSSMKPFIVATALSVGKIRPDTVIDTNPGFIRVGGHEIADEHNLGAVDVATILAKSSNVGMAHIALSLDKAKIWETLNAVGFGQVSASGFPGESAGLLSHYSHWHDVTVATIAHGYSISVTPLQLAQAYATLASFGIRRPVTFRKQSGPVPGERVLDPEVCRQLIGMLEGVVAPGGTAPRGAIRGYRVSGKTGTAWKQNAGGYSTNKYMSVFAGMVPAGSPRLVSVVVIDEPSNGKYYGGDVAAPVFSAVMSGALRLLAVPPDDLSNVPTATFVQALPPR
jgi:cell division protein FtsI (penicillin-binding protein 3)